MQDVMVNFFVDFADTIGNIPTVTPPTGIPTLPPTPFPTTIPTPAPTPCEDEYEEDYCCHELHYQCHLTGSHEYCWTDDDCDESRCLDDSATQQC